MLHLRQHQPWSADEDGRLVFLSSVMPLSGIARELNRSENAVRRRLTGRHGIHTVHELGRRRDFPIADAVSVLGVRHCTNVRRWIRNGWLRAFRTPLGPHNSVYTIASEDLVAFLQTHGATLPLDPPPGPWRDLVLDARDAFQARYVSRQSCAAALGSAYQFFIYAEDARGFPAPLRFRGPFVYYPRDEAIAWFEARPDYLLPPLCRILYGNSYDPEYIAHIRASWRKELSPDYQRKSASQRIVSLNRWRRVRELRMNAAEG